MAVLQGTKRAMKSSGQNNSTALGMKLTAKSYDLLISGLYQDVRRAFIRETATNCNDAHIYRDQLWHLRQASTSGMPTPVMSVYANKARHDVSQDPELIERVSHLAQPGTPFEVHLPTSMFPHASFRDYGIGMSLVTMLGEQTWDDDGEYIGRTGGLYTTLFESTKDDSNDFTGALGLGSKTPYAVSTAFTIRSVHEGKYHDYIAYKNDEGLPYCRCTSEMLDDDNVSLNEDGCEFPEGEEVPKDGLYIEVPLPEEDWDRYTRLAQEIFQVFDPMPIVRGGDYQPDPIKRDEQICNTYLQANNRWGGNEHYAIMGNVAYPINTAYLDGEAYVILNSIPNCTYTVFPIGSLNFQPSRDGLNYDDRTVSALNGYFSGIRSSIVDRLTARIFRAAQQGRFQMYDEIQAIRDEVGEDFLNSMKVRVGNELIGKKFSFAVQWPHKMVMDKRSVRKEDEHGNFHTVEEEYERMKHIFPTPTVMAMTHNRNVIRESSEQTRYMPYAYIRDGREIVFYQNDRTKLWRRALDIELTEISGKTSQKPVVYRVSTEVDLEEFKRVVLKDMGLNEEVCTFLKLSEVEIPKTARGGSSGPRNETPNVLRTNKWGHHTSEGDWTKYLKEEWEDIAEGSYYVDVKGWTAVYPGEDDTSLSADERFELNTMYSTAIRWWCQAMGERVYGIRRAGRKAIKEYGLKPLDFEAIFDDIRKENAEFPEDYVKATIMNEAIGKYHKVINNEIIGSDVLNFSSDQPERMSYESLNSAQSFLTCNQNTEPLTRILGEEPRYFQLRKYFLNSITVNRRVVNIQEVELNVDGEQYLTKSYHAGQASKAYMDMVKPVAFASMYNPSVAEKNKAIKSLARNHYAPLTMMPDFMMNEMQLVDWESKAATVTNPKCSVTAFDSSVYGRFNQKRTGYQQIVIPNADHACNDSERDRYEEGKIARVSYDGEVNYMSGRRVINGIIRNERYYGARAMFDNMWVFDKRVDERVNTMGYFPSHCNISDYV